MAKKKLTPWQRIKEQPVIAARLVGLVVGLVVVRFGLDLSEAERELITWGILLAAGIGIPETIAQWRAVTPVAKRDRLQKEGPQVNDEVYRRGRRG